MNTAPKKLVLVTGGSGYLGSAITKRFEGLGYLVVSLVRSNGVDVMNEVAVEKAVTGAVAEHGQIYACVHAAASPLQRKPLTSIEPDSFDTELMVAARGAYLLARAAKPHLAENATFVGITTEAIEPDESVLSSGAYIPAKYALRGVLRALTAEVSRVYAVAPGFLPGGLNNDMPQAVREMLAQKYRSPSAEDVAALVVELCQNSVLPTGVSVRIDRTYDPL